MARGSAVAAVCFLLAAWAVAQEPPADGFPAGEVVERVACLSDPEFTYALYLPSSYTTDRGWPVLFVMDPRGRARLGLDLFREAAERLGYILVSSYDTRSDVPRDRNTEAIKALLPDIEKRFSIMRGVST